MSYMTLHHCCLLYHKNMSGQEIDSETHAVKKEKKKKQK